MSSNIEVQRVCQQCGKVFTARTTRTKYCSHACNSKAYKAGVRATKVEGSDKYTKAVIAKPIEDIKSKAFLSINEACLIMGISRRTIYRMLERGELHAGKAGARTLIQRSEIDKLFAIPAVKIKAEEPPKELLPDEPFYTLAEVRSKYGISDKALYDLIKHNKVPKRQEWKTVYVSKSAIDEILNPKLPL